MEQSPKSKNRKPRGPYFSTKVRRLGKNRKATAVSVMASAIIGHPWTEFSETTVQRISWAATGARTAPKWFGNPELKSAEEDFKTHGYAPFFLPRRYSLYFSRNIMELKLATRWSAILIHKGERRQFVSACQAVARVVGADEMILLPEGTILEDLVRSSVTYSEFKLAAKEQLGPPDLDIHKIYCEREIRALRQKRIHYFLVSTLAP